MRRMLGIVATGLLIATLLALMALGGGPPRTAAQATANTGDTDAGIVAALAAAPASGGVVGTASQLALPRTATAAVAATALLSITSVSASYSTASSGTPPVPCYNCITTTPPPPPNSAEGLPIPLAALMHGTSGQYTVQYENFTYTGPCTIIFALVQGTKVIQSGSTSPTSCAANTIGYGTFVGTVPNKPGATQLVGIVSFGTQKAIGVQALTIQ